MSGSYPGPPGLIPSFFGPFAGGPGGIQNVVIPCIATTTSSADPAGSIITLTLANNLQWFLRPTNQQVFSAIADAAPSGNTYVVIGSSGPIPVYQGDTIASGAIADGDFLSFAYDSTLGASGGFHLLNWSNPGSGGSVQSVALTAPTEFDVTGSPVTDTGTLGFDWKTEAANRVFAGPSTGAAARPVFRQLAGPDLPAPGLTSFGGVKAIAAVANQWIVSLGIDGVFVTSQPAAADLSNGTSGTGAVALVNGPTLINLPAPTNAGDAVNKAYADAIASGLSVRASCQRATAAALAANTYANGAAGVGATLTGNANGAITVDGGTPSVADRILVKNEVSGLKNGIYTVTQVGDAGTPYILTRATDYDTSSEVTTGSFTLILAGSTNAATQWALVTTGSITIGTTALVFTQISVGVTVYTAGTGLSLVGTAFSITAPVAVALGGWNATTVGGGRLNFSLPVYVADRTAMAALDITKDSVAILKEDKREGTFVFNSTDLSTYVAIDASQGIYVAPASDTSGASGAWVRTGATGPVRPEWWYRTTDVVVGVLNSALMIQRAINYLEALPVAGASQGGVISLSRGTYLLNSALVMTKDSMSIIGQGAGNVANTTPSQVAPTILKVQQTTSAGIWTKGQNCTLADFYMTSDTARAAAAFDITKPGIRIEPPDTSSADLVSRTNVLRVRVDHQPGDNYLLNGPTNGTLLCQCEGWSSKGMGFRLDDGSWAGITRAFPKQPNLITISNCRALFNGGNALAISNPGATIQGVAVRILVSQFDCTGNADDALVRYSNHAVWMWAFSSTIELSGFGGSNAALAPEIHGGLFVAGRDIDINNCRFEECLLPVNVGQIATATTQGIWIRNFHVDQTSVTPAIAVVIAAGAVGVHMEFDVWGAFTQAMTDAEGCSQNYRGMLTEFSSTRTIAAGAVSVAENVAVVRGEGGVADDLVNIYFTPTPGVAPPDGTIFTMVNNAAYIITVRATGNIRLNGAVTLPVGTNQSAQFVSDSGRMLLVAGP